MTDVASSPLPSLPPFHTAVLIGRFQPVHNGHVALLRAALARATHLVVVLGSAAQAPSAKNPFDWQERAQMVHQALEPHEAARVQCVAVRDCYSDRLWVQAVQDAVRAAVALPPQACVALLGHFKDGSSSYLDWFAPWHLVPMPRFGPFDATPLRARYFGAGVDGGPAAQAQCWQAIAAQVPPSTQQFLRRWQQTALYARLRAEWQMLDGYRRAWAGAPYPPVFVTVDAVLHCHVGQRAWVLLVQRAAAPGQGLWALPGGFVEPRETLWQSCLRELREETGIALPEAQWQAALRQVRVFDHPDRSQRGRTVTHVHVLDLGACAALPPVSGGDDAALARWVALDDLPGMESAFFEDHFHILCCCLPQVQAQDLAAQGNADQFEQPGWLCGSGCSARRKPQQ